MAFTLTKLAPHSPEYGQIETLFLSAFPKEERPPFRRLKRKADQGKGDMLCAMDGDRFVGFAYMVQHQDLAYLFFLAVDEKKRGKGYGSAILQSVRRMYAGYRIFLAREQLDRNAPNYDQRVKRREFYLRNGFQDLTCAIKEADVVFDAMSVDGRPITAAEYDALISRWMGRLLKRIVDMRLIERQT